MFSYTLITETEAMQRFKLSDLMQRYSTEPLPRKSCTVRLHEGNLEISRLNLDWDSHWKGTELGLIVTGDLTVEGDIINSNINDGPFLLVQGNVKAKNLLAGGSEIYIAKDATFEELCVGEYNDGVLTIKGALQCALLINDDHHIDANSSACPSWNMDLPPTVDELKLSDYLVEEINIELQSEPYEYETVDVYEEILPRLIASQPVLRKQTKKKK